MSDLLPLNVLTQALTAAAASAPTTAPTPNVVAVSPTEQPVSALPAMMMDVAAPAGRTAYNNAPRLWALVGNEVPVKQLALFFDSLLAPTKTVYDAASAATKATYLSWIDYQALSPEQKSAGIFLAARTIDNPTPPTPATLDAATLASRWTTGALLPLPIWQVAASGSLVFSAAPADGSTVTIAGTVWTFKTPPTPLLGNQVEIGTVEMTVSNLANALTASIDPTLAVLTFAVDNADARKLNIVDRTAGAVGNAVTLAAGAGSNATASGATLSGGGWRCDLKPVVDAAPKPASAADRNALATLVETTTRTLYQADAHDPASDEAVKARALQKAGANASRDEQNRAIVKERIRSYIDNATALRKKLQTEVASITDDAGANGKGRISGQEARWNPYAVLFYFLEYSRAFEGNARNTQFVKGFLSSFTSSEFELLSHTSAGHAMLRRLWQFWAKSSAANRASAEGVLLRGALALAGDSLEKRAPGRVGLVEPPLTGSLDIAQVHSNDNKDTQYVVMAYGRTVNFVHASYAYHDKATNQPYVYKGVSTQAGIMDPAVYMDPARNCTINPDIFRVPPSSDVAKRNATIAARQAAWNRYLRALAPNEGNLDAASAFDAGAFSVGFQQWTATAREGPGLFERIKILSDMYYDLLIRALGVETGPRATVSQQAIGYLRIDGVPAAGSKITLGGTDWTFVSAAASGNQTKVITVKDQRGRPDPGQSMRKTAEALVSALNGSTDANVQRCTYSLKTVQYASKPNPAYATLVVVRSNSYSAADNSFALSASSSPASKITALSATLAGGQDYAASGGADLTALASYGDSASAVGWAMYQLFSDHDPVPCLAPTATISPKGNNLQFQEATGDDRRTIGENLLGWHAPNPHLRLLGDNGMRFCARWYIGCRYGLEVWQAQVELGYNRIHQLANTVSNPAYFSGWQTIFNLSGMPNAGANIPAQIRNLYGTEALLTAVLDVQINTPGMVVYTMRRAAARMMAIAGLESYVQISSGAHVPMDRYLSLLLLMCFLNERTYTTKEGQRQPASEEDFNNWTGRLAKLLRNTGDLTQVSTLADYMSVFADNSISKDGLVSVSQAADWPT